jgi:hypothetical protein
MGEAHAQMLLADIGDGLEEGKGHILADDVGGLRAGTDC